MTKLEYIEFHRECADKLVEITKQKNADYSGSGDDPFKNFRKRGALGFLVRMDDKMSRIESFLENGSYQVKDESFLDTCLDLANYAILLVGFLKSAQDESQITSSYQQPSCTVMSGHEFVNKVDPRYKECRTCGLEVRKC